MTHFDPRQAQLHQAIRDEWTDDVTVNAWRKWTDKQTIQTRAVTDAVVAAARLAPGLRVLDVASGTGQPAFTVAERIGPTGHVTATDLGPGMLAAAEESARSRGIGNVSFQTADVHDLPFPDDSFDRVTCRFGAMYFANPQRAFGEIRRVLAPRGRAAFACWGPREQPFMASTAGVLFKNLPAPPPPPEPDAPTPFRYAAPGSLTAALAAAGFHAVEEQAMEVPFPWPGPATELCNHFFDVAAPFRPVLASLGPEKARDVLAQVVDALRAYEVNGHIEMNARLVVAAAVR